MLATGLAPGEPFTEQNAGTADKASIKYGQTGKASSAEHCVRDFLSKFSNLQRVYSVKE
jgi:hypothetical protein